MPRIPASDREDRFRPKKGLGQHFLRDRAVLGEILEKGRFDPADRIIEVGAGLGALTLPLADFVHGIVAVEKDARMVDRLIQRLLREGIGNVRVVHGDILKLDLGTFWQGIPGKIKVVGNIPYNISSPLLERVIENRNRISNALLMFQFEFAHRLTAAPGSKAYGALSVLIQYHARVTPLLQVPREAFYPRPKVNSMVVGFDFLNPYPRRTNDEKHLARIVRGAFAHRRKTLMNSLRAALAFGDRDILEALASCGIEPRRRAETLDMDAFLCLSAALKSLS